jgi:hypothetical protein
MMQSGRPKAVIASEQANVGLPTGPWIAVPPSKTWPPSKRRLEVRLKRTEGDTYDSLDDLVITAVPCDY